MGRNSEIVSGIYASFGRGDVPAVLGVFDPGIEWRVADGFIYADGNPYIGGDSVLAGVFQRMVANVSGFTVVPARVIDGGDVVVVEGRYNGTFNATGKAVDAQFAHVWHLKDDRVVRFQQYTDTKQWAEAAAS